MSFIRLLLNEGLFIFTVVGSVIEGCVMTLLILVVLVVFYKCVCFILGYLLG